MSPETAPPGIECRFVNVWASRPKITPRLLLIHTNGASKESSLQAQLNWANSASDTTKPHYVVDRRGKAWKTLPSNRKGICNYQADAFGLSIETTDLGWPTPGGTIGFSPEQAETVARIVAWESELWDFPIVTPTRWDGTGVASHTDPFAHPYWTKYQGKACPGPQKKLEVRTIILPRANELRFPPPPPPPSVPAIAPFRFPLEDDMALPVYIWSHVHYANAFLVRDNGSVESLTPETFKVHAQVRHIREDHGPKLAECLAKCGLAADSLVPL